MADTEYIQQLDNRFKIMKAEIESYVVNFKTEHINYSDSLTTVDSTSLDTSLKNLSYGNGIQVGKDNAKGLLFTQIRKGDLFYRIVPNYVKWTEKDTGAVDYSTEQALSNMKLLVRTNQPNLLGYIIDYDCSVSGQVTINFNVTHNFLREGKNQPLDFIFYSQRWNNSINISTNRVYRLDKIISSSGNHQYMMGLPYIWETYAKTGNNSIEEEAVFADVNCAISRQKNQHLERTHTFFANVTQDIHGLSDIKIRIY